MATYSHSKISAFEQCPYKYKLHYIDKEKPEIPETIELFMGKRVHETLEKLYTDKKFKKLVSKATLLKFYNDIWEKEYSDDILVVKEELTAENYRKMGKKFIEDYYDNYKPFDQLTILGIETEDRMTLSDGSQWHVRIDKFACDDKGNYYVMDYKTNAGMKDQDEADEDRQLAMYSIWVKDKFKDVKSVKLVWHMLAFNKEVVSERTDEQLEKLQEDVISVIKKIEYAKEFPTNVTKLCDYCGFKNKCPSFKHQLELEIKAEESVKKFKEDDGLKLVDEFSEVKNKLKEFEDKQDALKADLIEFARQKGVNVVYGSNQKASIKEFDKLVFPENEEDYHKLIELLKSRGHWEECSMICYPRIQGKAVRKEFHPDIMEKLRLEKDKRISLSRRRDGEE
ncbi:PD-(D/E)XK nuclease family protein [Candidatus Pacearchaeota archaeon]|nr:PD-(D/E)XK nuclease family protein [Candidatus Pacearchaeota archaeon]